MIDYSSWHIYDGFSEGSGRSDKIWLINEASNEIGLFKYPKSNQTTEHISEKLATEISNLLGLACAKVEIGTYNTKIGSMSYRINNQDEILIEGIYLINRSFPYYDPNTFYDIHVNEYYSIEMILKSITQFNLQDEFLKILVFDFLIGNTDRHQNNWAVIAQDDKIRLSPIYDNGSSLCAYLTEESIDSYLSKDRVRFNSLIDSKSKSIIRIDKKSKKLPTHLEMLKYIKANYEDSVISFVRMILEKITSCSIDSALENYPDSILSVKKKQIIKLYLLEKVEFLKGVFFE